MGGAIGVGAAYPFDTLKTKAQTFEGKMAARVGSGAHGVGVGGPGGGGGEEAAAREDEKLLQSADEDEEEEVEERRETGTRCDVPGCTRVTWNGKSGTQCCRTCKASDGASHGPVCDETNAASTEMTEPAAVSMEESNTDKSMIHVFAHVVYMLMYYMCVCASKSSSEGEEQSAGGRPLSPACGGEGYQLPADYRDKWDSHHVRMPCSRRNMSSATQSWRWLKIRQALSPHNGFRDTGALIDAIKGYMGKPKQSNPKKWTFRALKSLVDEYYGPREKARFFQETLPFIIESALALPHRCPEPISLLRAGRTAGVNLTSLQIVSLLANGFLCTFPEDTRAQAAAERKFPRFNFYMLFEAPEKRWNPKANPVKQHIQKLLCIIHYFERQAARSDAELARSIVTFHRRSHEHGRSWERSTTRIGSVTLQVDAQGRIEDVDPTGADVWEADFANRFIGGGVLGSGCVQEEIRFLLSPELIASRLLTERMGDLESVLITGSERFSKYTGYADTFEFGGDFVDEAIKDVAGTADATAGALSAAEFRRKTTVVAMDALYFRNEQRPYASQFQATWIRRELDKALVAFQPRDAAGDGGDDSGVCGGKVAPWIATGNWGCGAFGGDPILKAVIQIVAAAEAGRNLKYLTFGDEALSKNIGELYGVMCDGDDGEGCTVRQLWLALEQFRLSRESRSAPVGGEELRSFLLGLQWSNLRPGHGQGSGAGVGGGSSAMVSSAHGQERRVAHGSIVVSDDEEVDRGVDEGPDCVVSKRARGEIATSPRREEALADEAAGSPKDRRQEEQDLGGQQDEASPKRVCGVP